MLLKPWQPVGPSDRKKYNVAVLVMAEESHRDAIEMAALLSDNDLVRPTSIYDSQLFDRLQKVDLRGGYGIVFTNPSGMNCAPDFSRFTHSFIRRAREYHIEVGWPYAFRKVGHYNYGSPAPLIEAGRSPDMRGTNLRDVIRRSIDDLIDGTYKEKGVAYGRGT